MTGKLMVVVERGNAAFNRFNANPQRSFGGTEHDIASHGKIEPVGYLANRNALFQRFVILTIGLRGWDDERRAVSDGHP